VVIKCPRCQTENSSDFKFCRECATPLPGHPKPPDISVTRTLEASIDDLTRGAIFAGRYEIIEELGAGGMGRVYRAFDKQLDEEIAIKFLRPEIAADKRTVERFRNEIKVARKITHPNVCRMHDLGEEKKTLFITMEYVKGEDLKSLVRRTGQLTAGKTALIGRQVAEGLTQAHKLGIVHRDLKPGNIMIDSEGNAKIMDFGIARSLTRVGTTAEGAIIGTPEYMSPEQVDGIPADQRADVYALGVILFEMVTGRVPFEGETAFAIANKHKSEPPPDPRALNANIPPDLSHLILRCLEKDREKRFQTTEEFLGKLEAVAALLPAADSVLGPQPSGTELKAARGITFKLNSRKFLIPALALIAVVVIVIGVKKILPDKDTVLPSAAGHSVAVLPFVDLTVDRSSEPLADGISDTLINALSQIPDLRVTARTSAFLFKGQKLDIREIGQKLNVRTVLEGSVQVMGNRLRVGAQLVNVDDGFQIWSEKYDRMMEDVFAIQDDIARLIVSKLKVEILGKEEEPLVKRPTENLEAYNFFLQGKYFLNKLTREDIFIGIEYFKKALELDPNFALVYASLATTYMVLGNNIFMPPDEAYPKAREFAERALELDDKLDQPYAVLAVIKQDYEWDFGGAENDFRKTIEINPGNVTAHQMLAFLLSVRGRHEEAIKEIKLARELNPLQARIRANVGLLLHWAGKNDEALEELKEALDFDPSQAGAHEYLGRVYMALGRYDDAIAHVSKAVEMEKRRPVFLIILAIAYARDGQVEESKNILSELEERSKKEFVSPALLAAAYSALGENDRAFELIDKAFAMRDSRLVYSKRSQLFNDLRLDPRFTAILKRMGLDD